MRRPDALELAAGTVVGWEPPPGPLPAVPEGLAPLDALQAALTEPLSRGPCHLAFSGGRDSSAILAAATAVARRVGVAPPIPLTLRFTGAPKTEETDWQESMVRHLGLDDWVRVDVGTELELLGPVATDLLRTDGLYWPANLHSYAPMVQAAAGGSLITGIDGDGLFDTWRWGPLRSRLRRPGAWELRDVGRLVLAAAPHRARRRALERQNPFATLPWLRPAARAQIGRRYADTAAAEPASWDRRTAWYRGQDHLRALDDGLHRLAAPAACRLVHPLRDERFLSSLARAGGARGYPDRTAALAAIFGPLLPRETVRRSTKADFTEVFWGPRTRAFADAWDGTGVDGELVDRDALRRAWRAESPDFRSASLLQTCWLHGTSPSVML